MAEAPAKIVQGITYIDEPLLESRHNVFELKWGTKPSFGFFSCSKSVYAALQEKKDSSGLLSGTLTFYDNGRTLELLNIYLVKATLNPDTHAYDIVLADRRILWQHATGSLDYNTYIAERAIGSSETEYGLDNKNSGNEWTYQEVIDSLINEGDNQPAIPRDGITRKPRNLRGDGRLKCDILQQIMYELNCYLVLDPIDDVIKILPLGQILEEDAEVIAELDEFIYGAHEIESTPLWKPANIHALYGNEDGSYGKSTSNVSGNETSGERVYVTPYMSSPDGIAFASEFSAELATDFTDAPLWRRTRYVGIREVHPSTEIHIIRWQSNALGSFTTIRREWPQTEPAAIPSHLFAYQGYVLPKISLYRIKILGNATGGGMYTCLHNGLDAAGEIDVSDGWDGGMSGSDHTGYFANDAEVPNGGSASGHALTTTASPIITCAFRVGISASDDKPVFAGNLVQFACEDES